MSKEPMASVGWACPFFVLSLGIFALLRGWYMEALVAMFIFVGMTYVNKTIEREVGI